MRTLAGQIPKIWEKILKNKHTLNTIKSLICVLHFNSVSKTIIQLILINLFKLIVYAFIYKEYDLC